MATRRAPPEVTPPEERPPSLHGPEGAAAAPGRDAVAMEAVVWPGGAGWSSGSRRGRLDTPVLPQGASPAAGPRGAAGHGGMAAGARLLGAAQGRRRGRVLRERGQRPRVCLPGGAELPRAAGDRAQRTPRRLLEHAVPALDVPGLAPPSPGVGSFCPSGPRAFPAVRLWHPSCGVPRRPPAVLGSPERASGAAHRRGAFAPCTPGRCGGAWVTRAPGLAQVPGETRPGGRHRQVGPRWVVVLTPTPHRQGGLSRSHG